MERFGQPDFESGEYVINTPRTSKSQENFLFNDRYFAVVNQCGNGWSRYRGSQGICTDIIQGTYEPSFQHNTRLIYVRDDKTGECWSVGYYPLCREPKEFEARHGPGYTIVRSVTDGIEVIWRLFVPAADDPVEVWTVTVRNVGRRQRALSIFAFAELSLETDVGLYGHASYLHSVALGRSNGVAARKVAMGLPNPYYSAVFLSARKLVSWDGNLNAFTGMYRTLANPVALTRGRCSNMVSSRDRVGAALHYRHALAPGKSARTDLLVGAANVFKLESESERYTRKYLAERGRKADRAFEKMQGETERRLSRVTVRTPEKRLDQLTNCWIPQLIEYGATHCRWGGMGYRDIVQQTQGAVAFGALERRRERLEQILSYQFPSGYAPRGFPIIHEDSSMKYADSAMWLIVAITEYLKESGDLSFLDRAVPYFGKGSGTVWDHLDRAARALGSQRGPHGLSLIWEGDWNDSLTHVGRAGRGESAWLSEAYCYTCLLMEELANHLGKRAAARRFRDGYEEMAMSINKHCWDGAWYVRAFDDDGNVIGSKRDQQGKIYLNAQSWALLAKIVPDDRLDTMLASVEKHLTTPWGHMLLYPTYTKVHENIGRLSLLEPGCSENASVYTHGESFLIMGLLQAGRADEAWDCLRRIMPYNPDNPSDAVLPYQLSNGYGGIDHRYEPGRAQFAWVTGSGTWMHMSIVEYLLGVRRTYDGIMLRPCVPSRWKKASVRRIYRDCTYEIAYRRLGGNGNEIASLLVDGQECPSDVPLPSVPGRTLRVEAVLR